MPVAPGSHRVPAKHHSQVKVTTSNARGHAGDRNAFTVFKTLREQLGFAAQNPESPAAARPA